MKIIKLYLFRLLCFLPVYGCLFLLMKNNLLWYDKHRILYHFWYVPITAFIFIFVLGFGLK